MKVLIILTRFYVNPFVYDPDAHKKQYRYLMPMGLGYISSVLKKAGHTVDIINLNHCEGYVKDIIHNKVKNKNYDFMFTGGVSVYYPIIRDIINFTREALPHTKIVVGGGIITSQPEIMIKLLKPDYAIIGEGEVTSLELVNRSENTSISSIDGIGYLDDSGEVVLTKPRKPIEDLDNIPLPDFDGFGYEEFLKNINPEYIAYDYFDKPRVYPILASRSCPFSCTFCFHTIGNKYRQRSIDNIMEEIKYAVLKYKINVVFFYDELFAYDKPRAMDFCKKMKNFLKTVPWEVRLCLNLRVDCADEEIIHAMKEVNCNPVGLGLESYSATILDSMKKHTTPEQILHTLEMIKSEGLVPQGAFIFGDSAETFKTASETLEFYKNNQDIIRGGVALGFVIPFQGSPLYKHCMKIGRIKDEIKFIEDRAQNGYNFYYPVNVTDNLSDKEFEKLKNMVFTTMVTAQYYSIPISSTDNTVTLKCPYCNEISTYEGFKYPRIYDFVNIGCRHCNGRFIMVSKLFPFFRIMVKTFGFSNIYKLKRFIGRIVKFTSDIKILIKNTFFVHRENFIQRT